MNLCPGDTIYSGLNVDLNIGNALPVSKIPIGTLVHNVEIKPGKGGQLMRAAGTNAKIIKKNEKFVIIRLNSGKLFSISPHVMATIGTISNDSHQNNKLRENTHLTLCLAVHFL